MIDNLRCANLSRLLPALRFVAFTITLLFCSLNTVFCLQKINKLSDPKQILSQGYYISFTRQLPNLWRIKSVRRTPGTIRCTPFVRSSLQSHRPPMCPGIFSPFYKIFEMHFGCISQDTYLLYVCKRNAKSLERPAFLPGTFSIAWFARFLTLPPTWPFLRSGTPLRWGHP